MSGKHIMVTTACEYCGEEYQVRQTKFNAGKAKYCSKTCFNEVQKFNAKYLYGYNNGKKYWDKNRWVVRWYDMQGKVHTTSYQKWYYENFIGEIPVGMLVTFADGDTANIEPRNIILVDRKYLSNKYCKDGHPQSEESKQKISIAHKGRTLSEEHKQKIGKISRDRWKDRHDELKLGLTRGTTHYNWRGGKSTEKYPPEFRAIRLDILDRDNNRCRICTKGVEGCAVRVHHIDANKEHNEKENLILLCLECHTKVHSQKKTSDPVILAFRSQLYK